MVDARKIAEKWLTPSNKEKSGRAAARGLESAYPSP
jgi:hypothetical protein